MSLKRLHQPTQPPHRLGAATHLIPANVRAAAVEAADRARRRLRQRPLDVVPVERQRREMAAGDGGVERGNLRLARRAGGVGGVGGARRRKRLGAQHEPAQVAHREARRRLREPLSRLARVGERRAAVAGGAGAAAAAAAAAWGRSSGSSSVSRWRAVGGGSGRSASKPPCASSERGSRRLSQQVPTTSTRGGVARSCASSAAANHANGARASSADPPSAAGSVPSHTISSMSRTTTAGERCAASAKTAVSTRVAASSPSQSSSGTRTRCARTRSSATSRAASRSAARFLPTPGGPQTSTWPPPRREARPRRIALVGGGRPQPRVRVRPQRALERRPVHALRRWWRGLRRGFRRPRRRRRREHRRLRADQAPRVVVRVVDALHPQHEHAGQPIDRAEGAAPQRQRLQLPAQRGGAVLVAERVHRRGDVAAQQADARQQHRFHPWRVVVGCLDELDAASRSWSGCIKRQERDCVPVGEVEVLEHPRRRRNGAVRLGGVGQRPARNLIREEQGRG